MQAEPDPRSVMLYNRMLAFALDQPMPLGVPLLLSCMLLAPLLVPLSLLAIAVGPTNQLKAVWTVWTDDLKAGCLGFVRRPLPDKLVLLGSAALLFWVLRTASVLIAENGFGEPRPAPQEVAPPAGYYSLRA